VNNRENADIFGTAISTARPEASEQVRAQSRGQRQRAEDSRWGSTEKPRTRYEKRVSLVPGDQRLSSFEYAFSGRPPAFDDAALVSRLAAAYSAGQLEFDGDPNSVWGSFGVRHAPFWKAFETLDLERLATLLRNPANTELFWGFDDLVKPFVTIRKEEPEHCVTAATKLYAALFQVAVGSGAIRDHNPEGHHQQVDLSVEDLLNALDLRFGFRIDFPNPFEFEFGLQTSRGVASGRAIQALYQTWRLKQIATVVGGMKILEIGAGLGRNVFYAKRFGFQDYTVVDIPTTQLAQGYYLGRVLGQEAISLHGEAGSSTRLRSPRWLNQRLERFDIVLNVDSLTELDGETALGYVTFARDQSTAFLSINHEANPASVADFFRAARMTCISRAPYWPRAGYVEELWVQWPRTQTS
jgi:hypothetical protein